MTLLNARNITFHRNGEPVFAPRDIELSAGACLLVTGPNGAGKTTLLRLIAGILRPSEGTIERAACAFAGHLPAVKGDLTCRENLRFARAFSGGGNTADVEEALARAGLRHLGLRPARNLSAGQKKRLSLARLLVTSAPLWLLDEPYASLDSDGAEMVDALLTRHLANGGGAVLSTHLRRPDSAIRTFELALAP